MAGYSSTPLWKKLGYKSGHRAVTLSAPDGYLRMLELPPHVAVTWIHRPSRGTAFVHGFFRDARELRRRLAQLRHQIVPDGIIWVSWPKKSSGVSTDITEDTVRDCALPLGLVDIKVCAVDETWSGLKLTIRKGLR